MASINLGGKIFSSSFKSIFKRISNSVPAIEIYCSYNFSTDLLCLLRLKTSAIISIKGTKCTERGLLGGTYPSSLSAKSSIL